MTSAVADVWWWARNNVWNPGLVNFPKMSVVEMKLDDCVICHTTGRNDDLFLLLK